MKKSLRLAFMGTPEFSVPALRALVAVGHEVACVYSQPPRAKGRGQQVQKSPVHEAAEALGIPVRTPVSLKSAEEQETFVALKLDASVVVAYGLLLPQPILDAPRLGCINIHASLLPRWRGAAPIHRALLAGDAETGITIMQMDKGLDTGGMFVKRAVPITATSTASQLHDALSALGATTIVEALPLIAAGTLKAEAQPETGGTYAVKLAREEGLIDWQDDAEALARKIRAFNPWPGAFFTARGERIKILEAVVAEGRGTPGALLDESAIIACGKGALKLMRVQREGRGAVDGTAFLRGFPHKLGEAL